MGREWREATWTRRIVFALSALLFAFWLGGIVIVGIAGRASAEAIGYAVGQLVAALAIAAIGRGVYVSLLRRDRPFLSWWILVAGALLVIVLRAVSAAQR